jgi:hypothetical protein
MDPFHPLSAGIEGRSPSWARTGRGAEQVVEVYPTLAVNVDLLRTLNPVETADQLGVAELGELLTRLRIRALIPTYPIPLGQLGALTISASGEVVIDFTGGGQETSAYLGGEARLRLRGFELAAEVLSSLDGDVRFMIIARYLRAQREAAQRADE